jgi:hypothetical protein
MARAAHPDTGFSIKAGNVKILSRGSGKPVWAGVKKHFSPV